MSKTARRPRSLAVDDLERRRHLEQADAGTVRIAGFDTRTEVEDARRSVGFMPERFGLYDELTVRDALDFFARVLGLESKDRRRRVDALLELCDLHGKASSGCGSLSKGACVFSRIRFWQIDRLIVQSRANLHIFLIYTLPLSILAA